MISVENLFQAWRIFSKGKHSKKDVTLFELHLEDNLFNLHRELALGEWKPDTYEVFFVQDPKLRRIHKASVTDRVLYQALYQAIYPIFDPHFIYDSYASRNFKGTHRGVRRLAFFTRKVSRNYRYPAFVLKCDVRKFFDSIDHEILLTLVRQKIYDRKLFGLLEQVIRSFEVLPSKGLPLGNVTSQIFANIYLNELDQFIKHTLKVHYYIRYCDDFVILSDDKNILKEIVCYIIQFLRESLKLEPHPNKVTIRKIQQGTDFLGYVSLPHYRVLRTKTKNRMYKKIVKMVEMVKVGKMDKNLFENSPASYLGILSHCEGRKILYKIGKLVEGVTSKL